MLVVGDESERSADADAHAALRERRVGEPPRLRHEPGLDGLRGLAVAAVVAFHLGHLRGGFLGVDLFFVLSGYLITSLLLAEQAGTGGIGLRRFWVRRARRLLPALFVVVLGAALLIAVLTPAGERPGFRGDALATLGYVANWHALADEADYWDMFVQPSPFDHMWSLAIEEQFYVVWPLAVLGLVALARRRSWSTPGLVAGVATVGAASSFVVLAATYDPLDTSRAYYGTDARVGPTLLGAALAAASIARGRASLVARGGVDAGRRSWPEPGQVALGVAALAATGWAVAALDGIGPAYYRGGLVVFSVAAVALVHLVTAGGSGPIVTVLRLRPLAALGTISYGVYLWHWPVIVYLTPDRIGLDGWALDAVCVGVTLAASVVSFVVVEQPIRRGALVGWRAPVGLVGGIAAAALAAVVATAGVARVPGTDVAMGSTPPGGAEVYPEDIPAGATRILLVGDSGPTYLGPELAVVAEEAGAVAASSSQPFCNPLEPEGTTRWNDGSIEGDGEPCHDVRRGAWRRLVEEYQPDVVVYYIAAGGGSAEVLMDGRWVRECEPDYDRYLVGALREDADLLGASGATVLFATTPAGPFTMGGSHVGGALGCRRATLDAVAAARPDTAVVDMAAVVAAGEESERGSMFRDPVHLSEAGAERVADWLVPEALGLAR
ncbi:MAG TPA: acyltransferase family protein [Acidimicrobiales bacterium]|nr:acyltransferase family protein [Acidimicrobiales bacterium]